jgi:hypothetical protein
MISCVVLL